MWLQIRANNLIALTNKGQKEWAGNESNVCGFGKGSFKIIKMDADLPDGAIEFSLSGSDDLVCYKDVVQKLGDVLKELRKKNPETKVTYYKLTFDTDDPHKFTVRKTHRVVFMPRPEEKSGEMKEFNAGCREKLQLWENSASCTVLWHVKASPVKGLIPVKPAVFLRGSASIGPGQSLLLAKPS
ncbi:unnamed protein product [Durusdinium trenchii]|uniref:Uncharacterized protein n=1 Tax=Durusdinium trenchii TaxID=1381693 RepID=A0ABP0SUJ7_9DINO